MSISDWDAQGRPAPDEITGWQSALREVRDRFALWMGRDPLTHDWFFRPRRNPGRLLGRLATGLCAAIVIASGAILWLDARPPRAPAPPHAHPNSAAREEHR